MEKYIITIDQGTTSTRAVLFDKKAKMIDKKQMEFSQITPTDGIVLHNATEILNTVLEVVTNIINSNNLCAEQIDCIGITNQRETTVLFDKHSGKPVCLASCWQSRGSQYICDELLEQGYGNLFCEKTGLIINPYFSATKIRQMFDQDESLKKMAVDGDLLFGTVDTFLLYNLTNKRSFKTDYSNASRTMLFNIKELCWDAEILSILDIPSKILPEVCNSSDDFGYTELFGGKIKITSLVGDQQASLFGHNCFKKGDTKITYGTGLFMLMNTKEYVIPSSGLLSTIAWGLNGEVTYCLEGSVFVCGSAVKWLKTCLGLIDKTSDSEAIAQGTETTMGVYFVPAFVGLGTPYWNNDARGSIFGLSYATTKDHIVKATLDSLCYQAKDVFNVMKSDIKEIETISVDGGASVNNYLMQFQADMLETSVIRPKESETTALGACFLAGLKTGFFESLETITKLREIDRFFLNNKKSDEVENLYKGWLKAVKSTIDYAK